MGDYVIDADFGINKMAKNNYPLTIEDVINSKHIPTGVTGGVFSWLYQLNYSIYKGGKDVGKWVMIFNADEVDANWKFIRRIYQKGELEGVNSVKCCIRNKKLYTVLFYCYGSANERHICNIGKKLLKQINYNKNLHYTTDNSIDIDGVFDGNFMYMIKN